MSTPVTSTDPASTPGSNTGGGNLLIRRLKISGMLSFGPQGIDLPMEPLNVLIGPNGSGKSNFIEALALLQAAPHDLSAPARRMGGISEWLWKGDGSLECPNIDAVVSYPEWRHAHASYYWWSVSRENGSRSGTRASKMNMPILVKNFRLLLRFSKRCADSRRISVSGNQRIGGRFRWSAQGAKPQP